jgi:hypothetical protein
LEVANGSLTKLWQLEQRRRLSITNTSSIGSTNMMIFAMEDIDVDVILGIGEH